jgi:lipopolysaccharide/colanic/teichoic acid biosynthesis glycosyltransferase
VAKRLFDLFGAGLGLVVLAPFMLLIALAIKLDSPGPAFFRQERVGRYGKPFRIHKFRTMRHDPAGGGPQITVGADPRITRFGGWLRGVKLDELPQLIDVLQGTMSLVGPRPEVPRYVSAYPAELRERVLAVRPGITDPTSITFRNEAELLARAVDPEREYIEQILPEKLAMAVRYAEDASVASDLLVLLRTAGVLCRR